MIKDLRWYKTYMSEYYKIRLDAILEVKTCIMQKVLGNSTSWRLTYCNKTNKMARGSVSLLPMEGWLPKTFVYN
jgi:hypothetical protein